MYSLLILTRNQLKYARSKQGVGVGSRCLQEGIVRKGGLFQPNLEQIIPESMGFKFVQIKAKAFPQGELIVK